MSTMGDRLKSLRLEKDLLQKDMAEKLNITTSAYGYYEKNERQPSNESLKTLASFFDVSVDYLLGLSDDRNSTENQYEILSNTLVAFAGEIKEMDEFDKQMLLDFAKGINERNKKKEGKDQ